MSNGDNRFLKHFREQEGRRADESAQRRARIDARGVREVQQALERIARNPGLSPSLDSRGRTPAIYLRHRQRWTGWSVRLIRRAAGELDWELKHARGALDGEPLGRRYTSFHVSGQRVGERLGPVDGNFGLLSLQCECCGSALAEVSVAALLNKVATGLRLDHDTRRLFVRHGIVRD